MRFLIELINLKYNIMNTKVYAELISRTGCEEVKERLVRAIEDINDTKIARFIDIMYGIDKSVNDLKPKTLDYNSRVCTLVKLDYLNDKVDFIYEDTNTRYFPTQEDADNYSTTGNYDYNKSHYNPKDEYPFKGEHTHTATNWTTISEWEDRAEPTVVE